jgi:PAS domain S-box-containing protein
MLEWLLKQAGDLNEFIALVTVITGGGLWVVKMLMAGRKRFEAMFVQNQALQKSVNEIVAQLKPNGGTSMFDMVKQAHKLSLENVTMVAQTLEAVDRIKAYQWQFAETLSDKPIWESDETGSCIRVNTAYAKLAERTVAELTGAGWENFVHPEDRSRVYDEWVDAVNRKRIFEGHFRVRSRSGKTFQVRAVSMPVLTENGKITSFLGRYDEVTPLP